MKHKTENVIKVGGVQFAASLDTETNIKQAVEMAKVAAENGVKILCFQQMFANYWFPATEDREAFRLAETIEGPTIQTMASLAAELEMSMLCPFFERSAGKTYSSCAAIDSKGLIVGLYRKKHIPELDLWKERGYFHPGDLGYPVFRLEGLNVGVAICWDMFFAEPFAEMSLAGADLVFAPSAAAYFSQDRWLTVARAQAIMNNVYVFRVNRVGEEQWQTFYGASFCVDPYGDLIDEPSEARNALVIIGIDPQKARRARREFPFVEMRRSQSLPHTRRMEHIR